jgi:hypothetical protein
MIDAVASTSYADSEPLRATLAHAIVLPSGAYVGENGAERRVRTSRRGRPPVRDTT